jgi:subtilisin family serine protease
MMMRAAVLLFIFLAALSATAQQQASKWWVQFTDRTATPYSLHSPEDFLSKRALARRANQGIQLDSTDLPVNPSYINAISSLGIPVLNQSKWFNAVTIETDRADLLAQIAILPFVKTMEPVTIYHLNQEPPLDTASRKHIGYGWAWSQVTMMNGDFLHDRHWLGDGMQIAVLDNGFSLANEIATRSDTRMMGGYDFVDRDLSYLEKGTHGTIVFSVMASRLPDLTGTAPEAGYWLIRTEDPTNEQRIEEDNWIAGAEFADSAGADLINSSLGYSTFFDANMNYSYADLDGNTTRVTQGADMAARKGILVVNSAGNSGSTSWRRILAPADGDSVLAVGAVDEQRQLASFSSVGPSVAGRIKPDVSAMGQGTWVHFPTVGTFRGNGTSFSAPLVTGLAACLWQAFPEKTNMEIIDAIRMSASRSGSPDTLTGYGIPDFMAAFMLLDGAPREVLFNEKPILFPTPSGGDVEIMLFSQDAHDVQIRIYDIRGRLTSSEILRVEARRHTRHPILTLAKNTRGVYFVEVISKEVVYLLKAVKL